MVMLDDVPTFNAHTIAYTLLFRDLLDSRLLVLETRHP